MLKYEHDPKNLIDRVEVEGDIATILSEVTWLIRRVYNMIRDDNPEMAETYKEMISKSCTDPTSPIWMDYSASNNIVKKLEHLVAMLKEEF